LGISASNSVGLKSAGDFITRNLESLANDIANFLGLGGGSKPKPQPVTYQFQMNGPMPNTFGQSLDGYYGNNNPSVGTGDPTNLDLLSEKSFRFQNLTRTYRAARITKMVYIVRDMATNVTYKSSFTLEIGTPISNKYGTAYGKIKTVNTATMVLNATATQYMFASEILSNPLTNKIMLSNSTLPYIYATLANAKLNSYIPGSSVTANTFTFKTIIEKDAVWVNAWQGLLERLGIQWN
jgi:hypothetical protein